jgi:hypothetical protein
MVSILYEIPFVSVVHIQFFAPNGHQFIAVLSATAQLSDIHLYGYE